MEEVLHKDQLLGDSGLVMRNVETTLQTKLNLSVPALCIEISLDGKDWDYDDLYDTLESFGEIDMLETNADVAVVLYKKFFDAYATLEFLRDKNNLKIEHDNLKIRWYKKEDEASISKSFKRKIQTYVERNLKEKETLFDNQKVTPNPTPFRSPNMFHRPTPSMPIYNNNLGYLNSYEMSPNQNNQFLQVNNNLFQQNVNYHNSYSGMNNNYNYQQAFPIQNGSNIFHKANSSQIPQNSQFYQPVSDFNSGMNNENYHFSNNQMNNGRNDFPFVQHQQPTHKYSFNSSIPQSFNLGNDTNVSAKRKNSSKNGEGKEKPSNEKFTCKFDIGIENDNEFQVCRRLIGSKGCNMKNIVDICKNNTVANTNEPVKLRLRGKGSGYKEGPEQKESEESLHLCVSSKFIETYFLACKLVEDLILQLYDEYRKFAEKKGIAVPRLVIRKTEGEHSNVNYNMGKTSSKKCGK